MVGGVGDDRWREWKPKKLFVVFLSRAASSRGGPAPSFQGPHVVTSLIGYVICVKVAAWGLCAERVGRNCEIGEFRDTAQRSFVPLPQLDVRGCIFGIKAMRGGGW